jgi:hypothetical protein
VKAVDGMYVLLIVFIYTNNNLLRFLLVQLYLESLVRKRSLKAIWSALKNLPSRSNTYNYTYKDTMIRIKEQVNDQEELAK